MGNVFANGKEVSAKKNANKSVAAMMSVCLSPPAPPAGPIPIPYPVTDMASNTTDGSGSVYVQGKEVGKKNGSSYKKCSGNEPATRNFGMDVVSHTIQGKTKFEAYSFDVMFEKSGAERFMDLTTTNHASPATAAQMSAAQAAPGKQQEKDCKALTKKTKKARKDLNNAVSGRAPSTQDTANRGTVSASVARPGSVTSVNASHGMMRSALARNGTPVSEAPPYPAGYEPDRNSPVASKVCGGGHSHRGSAHARHCEAQAIDSLSWSPKPKSITFAIDYPAISRKTGLSNPKKKNMPCTFCRKLLKKACECGVAIYICKNGKPENYCKSF